MKRRAVVLPEADRDIDQISDYLDDRRRGYGGRFVRSVNQVFKQLAKMPGLDTLWGEENPTLAGLRCRPIPGFENSLAFYRPTDDGIEVVRVLHGARDIDSALDDEGRGGA